MPHTSLPNIESLVTDLENVASYCQNALNQCQSLLELLREKQPTRYATPHQTTTPPSNHQIPSAHQLSSNQYLSAGISLHDSHSKSFVDLGIRWDAEDYNSNQGIEASMFDLSSKARAASVAGSADSSCNLSGTDQTGVIRRPTVKSLMNSSLLRTTAGYESSTAAQTMPPVPAFANRKEKTSQLRGYGPDNQTSRQPNDYRWSGTSPTASLSKVDKPTALPAFAMEVIGVSDDSIAAPHHDTKHVTSKKSSQSFEVPKSRSTNVAEAERNLSEQNTRLVKGSAFRLPFIERSASVTSSVEVECPDSSRSEVLQSFETTALKIDEEEETNRVGRPSPNDLKKTPSFTPSIHRSKDQSKILSTAAATLSPTDKKTESRLAPPRKSLAMTTLLRLPKEPRSLPAENFKWYYLWFLLPAYDHKGNNLRIESFEAKDLENLSLSRNGLHPKSIFNTTWDFLATVLFVLIVWFIPYFISFEVVEDHVFVASIIASIVFAVDALVSVFTPIPQIAPATLCTIREYELMRPSLREWVRVKLLENLIFIPLAVVPFDLIFSHLDYAHVLLILRLLWVFRLPATSSRCAILKKVQGKLDAWTGLSISKVIPIACGILTFIHLNACALYYFGRVNGFVGWQGFLEHLDDATEFQFYAMCFYHSVGNMFPHSLIVQTETEHFVQSLFIMTAAILYATFIGAISSVTLSVNPAGRLYTQKVDELNDYVKWKNLSAATEKRLLRYYETKYRGKYFEEDSLLSEMNESLRAEILLQNTKSLIENVPFLKRKENDGRDEIFMGRIATALRSQYYVEGDYVTKQGENGQDMFFILSGKLDVIIDGVKKASLFDGGYIGEVALISKVLRTATVQAAKPSILYRLTYTDFHKVLGEFPDLKARIRALASEREQIVLARELSHMQATDQEK
ncbi:Potassium voltage-gated channel sub H member 7 [Chytriomyces hyalinus]|nr:Potassium voltage-gated channel sub H member 7 [Chytriomyces hyalinus]